MPISRSRPRAVRTAVTTSPTLAQRKITAGRRSTIAFQIVRVSSYVGSPGSSTVPSSRLASFVRVASSMHTRLSPPREVIGPAAVRPGSVAQGQAERVPGRVREDPEAWAAAAQPGRARRQNLRLAGIEVADHDVEVRLLGPGRVRPSGWRVVADLLEHQAGAVSCDESAFRALVGEIQAEK